MAMAEVAESWKDRRRATMTATLGPQSKEGGILEERPAASGLGWVLYFMGGERRRLRGGHRGAKKEGTQSECRPRQEQP